MSAINNNLMAANVANNLNAHYGRLATSVQRLSSGLRINSSSDDAAGLAIRELMRADVAALNQGARNANDAISMLQVADGALAIIDEKLIRMKELAEQAATGTYNSTQRLIIDSEYQAMAAEIDRIARATDFNGIKLLDGSLSGKHNGSGLQSTGMMKIHFGAANDSAEDYYYVQIGDCTTKGLGLGTILSGTQETVKKVETISQTQMTFTTQDSYVVYRDPVTSRPYYTDGDFFFSDSSNPGGTLLDWETDREIIERLETEIEQRHTYTSYAIYVDGATGREYYSPDRGTTFVASQIDPSGSKLDEITDAAIIARLTDTGKTHAIWIGWEIYENGNGDKLFTCDGGLTFVPNASNPTQNVLDTAVSAHQNILNDYNPVLVARQNPPITVYVNYLEYYDTRNNNIYYSSDGGKTFVSDPSNPSTSVLNPSNPYQKAIIDNLAPRYIGASYTYEYERYLHLDTGKVYYSRDGGKTFVDDTATPTDIVLDGGVPADAADIARLEKQYATTPAEYTYEVYEDRANNNQLWYTGDGGKSFFSDVQDPAGSALTPDHPDFAALTAQFAKTTRVEAIKIRADVYTDPATRKTYYSGDGGKTFSTSYMDLQKVALDSANPADLVIIQNLRRNPSMARHFEYFNWFTDPDTKIDYYTPRGSTGDLYTTDMAHPENIALDANNPADKAIIDKLVQHQATSRGKLEYPQPPNFLVYENTLNNHKVYSWVGDDGVTRYSYVTDSYPGITADSPEGQALIPNLRPYMVNKVEITYITDIEAIPNGVGLPGISTQQDAQEALVAIDRAIVSKDQIRAHLGALQNRLENTVTSLNIQAENMRNAESRISDADVANEMTNFVRNQILTQSAVAMLGQANSYPHMLMGLING